MPTCAKGKSTTFLTLRYKFKGEWQEIPSFVISEEWDTCAKACPEGTKFVEGKCIKVRYGKPKVTKPGELTIMGFTIEYEIIKEEIVDEEVCEYECEKTATAPEKKEEPAKEQPAKPKEEAKKLAPPVHKRATYKTETGATFTKDFSLQPDENCPGVAYSKQGVIGDLVEGTCTNIQDSGGASSCYLASDVFAYFNKPEAEELQFLLANFMNDFMQETDEKRRVVSIYERLVPALKRKLDGDPRKNEIYRFADRLIVKGYASAKAGDYQSTYQIYIRALIFAIVYYLCPEYLDIVDSNLQFDYAKLQGDLNALLN